MDTNVDVTHNEDLNKAATRLLVAAKAYWEEYQRAFKNGSAVVWLQGDDGSLVVFTRGEYKWTLMQNIEHLRRETRFGG